MSDYQGFSAAVIGMPGTGKTSIVLNIANNYEKVLFVLLDDSDDKMVKIREINNDDIGYFKKGYAKVFIYENSKLILENIFVSISKSNVKTLIVFDDIRFLIKNRPQELRKLYGRRRHLKLDLIFTCHGLSEFPNSLFPFITNFLIFQTSDNWRSLRSTVQNVKTFERIIEAVNTKAIKFPHYFFLFETKNNEENIRRLNILTKSI